jgi:hypothetical protein
MSLQKNIHEQLDHLTKEYHTKLFQLTQQYMEYCKDMHLSKDLSLI